MGYPAIRTTPSAARAGYVQTLTAVLEDTEATIEAIERVEKQVAALMQKLQQRKAVASNALAPVTGLPVELLTEIFLIVAANDKSSWARIILSHVSSVWRAVALDMIELWTVIDHPSMLHDFATRSASLRLHLSTNLRTPYPTDFVLDEDVASRLSTWSSASFSSISHRARSPEYPDGFVASLARYAHILRLDELHVSGPAERHWIHEEMASTRSLHVSSTQIQWSTAWKRMDNLAELVISNVTARKASITLSALYAPSLSRITLSGISNGVVDEQWWSDAAEQGDCAVEADAYDHSLKALDLHRCWPGIYTYILGHWDMPNLESLTIGAALIECSVSEMSLALREVFSKSPMLQYLEIAIDHVEEYEDLIVTIFETPASSLHTISLRGARYWERLTTVKANYDPLIEVLEARALSGIAPLRHLSVGVSLLGGGLTGRDPRVAYRAASEIFVEINDLDDDV